MKVNPQLYFQKAQRQMKSLRGKPRSIMFLGFNSILSQQAAGNLTQERLKLIALNSPANFTGFINRHEAGDHIIKDLRNRDLTP